MPDFCKVMPLSILICLLCNERLLSEDTLHIKETTSQTAHHVDELAELELDAHGERIAHVQHGPHQLVIVAKQVVVEALRVRVADTSCTCEYKVSAQ